MTDTVLITNTTIVKDASFLQRDGYIYIKNGVIAETGPMSKQGELEANHIIDGTNKLAIPGLINGHNHSPMTLFRGMADDLPLQSWLHEHIFPAEAAHVTEEMVYTCSKLAACEMILSGTTAVADGYFYSDQTAKAFEEIGLRAIVAHGILDFPAPGVPDPKKNIATVEEYIKRWKNSSKLITPAVFTHSPYTCSPATLKKAKDLADRHDVRFFIHLAEMKDEHQVIIDPAGKTPLQHLHNLNLLDENCILIHSIWLDDKDLDILAASGSHVIACPQSNCKLASGVIKAHEMLSKGIKVGLGTDSAASNNSLDMFSEMDFFAKTQKVMANDPTVYPAEKVFQAATAVNNDILNFSGLASICPGNRADLALIDLNTPHLTPFYNQDLLVYGVRGNDVSHVIIDGKLVVSEKQVLSTSFSKLRKQVYKFVDLVQRERK